MPKIYNSTPKNIPPSRFWNAERIYLDDINDFVAKVLIYDDVAEPVHFPLVNDRLKLFEKSGFNYVKYEPDENELKYEPFSVKNIYKKVYSKRYACTAYICFYKIQQEEGSLSNYITSIPKTEVEEESKTREQEKVMIALGVDEKLQEFIAKRIREAEMDGKIKNEVDRDAVALKAFNEFFEKKLESEEALKKAEKILNVGDERIKELKRTEIAWQEYTKELENEIRRLNIKLEQKPKQEEEGWIKIKEHDGSSEERSRVILELRRVLKQQTLDAVKQGYSWNNATQKLEKRFK